jgi:hypothetical protein
MSKMFTVSLAGLAGLGLAMTGCGGEGDAGFEASWSLALIGTNQLVTCDDAGTPTVVLEAFGANDLKSRDTFPCGAMGGVSRVLPQGRYQVVVSLLNGAGQEVSATQDTFDLARGGVHRLPDLTFDIQSFGLTWTILRGSSLLTCDQAGAKSVRLTAMAGDNKPVPYVFPCGDRAGDTTAVPLGPYSLTVELLDGANQPLASPLAMSVVVDAQKRAQLDPIIFRLN